MQWYTCQFIWDITLRCDENITKAPHLRFALPGTSNQMESHNTSSNKVSVTLQFLVSGSLPYLENNLAFNGHQAQVSILALHSSWRFNWLDS